MPDLLYWLDHIQPAHRNLVGDKAFYLGMLQQRGCPVISGFTVSAAAFLEFLEQINWLEPMFADLPNSSLHLDVDNPHQLQAVAQQIQQAIQTTPLPTSWLEQLDMATQPWRTGSLILRPSFTVSSNPTVSARTIGLLDSQICTASSAAIAHSLKRVWTELFRAKSLLYWQRLAIPLQQIRLAVLVQPIPDTIAAGEIRLRENHWEVRAVWGFGQALAAGEATPDRYLVMPQSEQWTRYPGNQTRAYRPTNCSSTDDAEHADCLQAYSLERSQQGQPVLSPDHIQGLIRLMHQSTLVLGTTFGLEWALCRVADSETLQLTQAIPELLLPLRHQAPVPIGDRSSRLTGLSVAPGKVQAIAYVINHPGELLNSIPTGAILVAPLITPSGLVGLKQVVGLVTEQGGTTSHGAILAREQGIPAVVGVDYATRLIQTGDVLRLDGDRGEVYRVKSEKPDQGTAQLGEMRMLGHQEIEQEREPIATPPALWPAASIANGTRLYVSLSQVDVTMAQLPVDGVGLLRSDLMLLRLKEQLNWTHPQECAQELSQTIAEQMREFVQAFAPRPVFYRSLDVPLDDHQPAVLADGSLQPEPASALGLRGALSYQTHSDLFASELAALRQLQQWGYTNIRLIVPFVRTVEEFRFCRQQVEQARLFADPEFQLWMMAEVPSVLLLLPDYIAAGVQGIAIGSNDLTQLLLGVDRDQPQLASAFNAQHPAVLRAIRQIVETAKQAGIPCSLCGQAARPSPELVESLIRWGITAISVEPGDIAAMTRTIAHAETRLLLDAARLLLDA